MTKQFTLSALGCLLLAGTAFAVPYDNNGRPYLPGERIEKKINGKTVSIPASTVNAMRAPRKATVKPNVITDVDGFERIYVKAANGLVYDNFFNNVKWYNQEDIAAKIVYAGANEAYFWNIFSYEASDSYVKGTIEQIEDQETIDSEYGTDRFDQYINVSVPQTVDWYDYDVDKDGNVTSEGWGVNLALLKLASYEEDGVYYLNYVEATDYDHVSFLLDVETGEILLDLPGERFDPNMEGEDLYFPEYALGYVITGGEFDGNWTGFADFYQDYIPFAGAVEMPADANPIPFVMKSGPNYGYGPIYVAYYEIPSPLEVGKTERRVYFQGLNRFHPEMTVYGIVEDVKKTETAKTGFPLVYIPQDQVVGVEIPYFVRTKVAYDSPRQKELSFELAPDLMGYYFVLDPNNNFIIDTLPESPQDPDHFIPGGFVPPIPEYLQVEDAEIGAAFDELFLIFNFDDNDVAVGHNESILKNLRIYKQFGYYGLPTEPYNLDFTDDTLALNGYCNFSFSMGSITEDGTVMDLNDLFYRIFMDYHPDPVNNPEYWEMVPVYFGEQEIEIDGEKREIYPGLLNDWLDYKGTEEIPEYKYYGGTSIINYEFENDVDIVKSTPTRFNVGIYDKKYRVAAAHYSSQEEVHPGFNPNVDIKYVNGSEIHYIGVESYYVYGGEQVPSVMCVYEIPTGLWHHQPAADHAGVGSINSVEEVSAEFYNLAGQRVNNPENGIYIKRSTLSDGSVIVNKVVRR